MTSKIMERLARRTAVQSPISQHKCRVMYLVGGKQRKSPWFYTIEHAQTALLMMKKKYGDRNAILYRD